MIGAERSLLLHRLEEMAALHESVETTDGYADTAEAIQIAIEREDVLCARLLRDAIEALRAP